MSSSSERPPYISESGLLAEPVVVLREGTAWSLMCELASRSSGLTQGSFNASNSTHAVDPES